MSIDNENNTKAKIKSIKGFGIAGTILSVISLIPTTYVLLLAIGTSGSSQAIGWLLVLELWIVIGLPILPIGLGFSISSLKKALVLKKQGVKEASSLFALSVSGTVAAGLAVLFILLSWVLF